MNDFEVLVDLAPTDVDAVDVLGGGIPISLHLGTPVLIGQNLTTIATGPLVEGFISATV